VTAINPDSQGLTPLAARAVSSWLTAFGVACVTPAFENDIKQGAGDMPQPVRLLRY
jgi:hypothetical protein